MSTKYTPGPWTILPEECGKDYIRIRGTRLGGRYKVANVITPVYAGAPGRELDETRANARLIAAAPRLEEALSALLHRASRNDGCDLTMTPEGQAGYAALAAATGEQ